MTKSVLLYIVNVDWFFLSHRLPVALKAQAQGFDVHVLTNITDREDELLAHGFKVHKLSVRRGQSTPASLVKTFLEIRKAIKLIKPNLVHLITIKPVLLGGIASRLLRVPGTVVAISGLGTVFIARGLIAGSRRFLVKWIYKWALRNNNLKIIFQNPCDRELISDLVPLKESQIVMIPGSGVDLNVYKKMPIPDGRPIVMLAARLLHEKGIIEFLYAGKTLKNTRSLQSLNPRFVLVGQIDPDNPFSLTADDIKTIADEGIVELWGHKENMNEILPKASIIVLPSYREGLPKVLIEAAACGRPVITTDVPGCRDAIIEGATGILVPPRDVQALSSAIEQLLLDQSKLLKMGTEGRKLAEQKFDIENVVITHLKTYNSLFFNEVISNKPGK